MSNFVIDHRTTSEDIEAWLRGEWWCEPEHVEAWLSFYAGAYSVAKSLVDRGWHLPGYGWEHHHRHTFSKNGEMFVSKVTVRVLDWAKIFKDGLYEEVREKYLR